MVLFKELSELGYKHYTENAVEELDNLQLSSEERIMEQALVFRWFREKYNLYAEPYTEVEGTIYFAFKIRDFYSEKYVYDSFQGSGASFVGGFSNPAEAELACLRKMIEIVKKEKQTTEN